MFEKFKELITCNVIKTKNNLLDAVTKDYSFLTITQESKIKQD